MPISHQAVASPDVHSFPRREDAVSRSLISRTGHETADEPLDQSRRSLSADPTHDTVKKAGDRTVGHALALRGSRAGSHILPHMQLSTSSYRTSSPTSCPPPSVSITVAICSSNRPMTRTEAYHVRRLLQIVTSHNALRNTRMIDATR
jgi:hypothetical protein